MPIQINLLSEAQAEEDLRRRDPVKRAIFFGALLVALALVWFSSILVVHVSATSAYNRVQTEIQAHTNDYNVVVGNIKSINDIKKRLDALQKLSSVRLLQGNLLNALQQLYIPNVSLIRLQVEQTYAGKSQSTSSTGSGTPVITQVVEHTVLMLDAKDSSPNPGDQVNHYKDKLSQIEYFSSSLDTNNSVKLSNLSSPQTGQDGKSFVLFTLECHFPNQTR